MSFILDALRKSETDRQQKGSAEFTGVPTSNSREKPPRWLWGLGLLLAINVVVLLGLLLRPDAQPAVATTAPPAQAIEAAPVAKDEFASQVAAARENAPPREEPRPIATQAMPEVSQASVASAPPAAVSSNFLPTIHELVANGTIVLPELHVDVHVYSEVQEDRFVFINMNKHMEGSRLAEGPRVREITRDGVVLDQNGITFLLPRE
ncbi:MAG: general secretion pathway protein GspB [Gammaproteobacteria bacterium]|nr:general secretion pathway protein GspB [Gammaproteobacteria bacterium]